MPLGYNESLEVGVFNEFATAAFRYGHSQVGNTMLRLNENWNILKDEGNLDLRDAYFNPGRVLHETGGLYYASVYILTDSDK